MNKDKEAEARILERLRQRGEADMESVADSKYDEMMEDRQ